MAEEITFVGAGTASATDGATAPAPSLPAGLADDDLMLTFFYSREITDGTVSISAGWTPLVNDRSAGGLLAVWYRFRQPGDVAPTITLGNHALNDTAIAQMAAWRGVRVSDPVHSIGVVSTNTASVSIGGADGIAGVPCDRLGLVVIFGGKLDDFTSVATLPTTSPDELVYNEIGEPDSTLGTDAGMVWDYAINELSREVEVPANTFVVTGGSSVAGKGIMIAFKLDPDPFVAADHIGVMCAISHPLTDSGIPGGYVDPTMRALFTDIAANDDIEVLSDDAADTSMAMTIRGLDPSGNSVVETKQLNGVTAVIFSILGTIERIEEAYLTSPASGTVTVRRSVAGATIAEIPPGERGFRRIFRNTYSHPTLAKNYYEKIFVMNLHNYYTIQNVSVIEDADPSGFLTFALAAEVDDAAFSGGRLEEPDADDLLAPDTFDATLKYIPGGGSNLDPGESAGIWLKMSIPAAEAVFKDTYGLEIAGEVPA